MLQTKLSRPAFLSTCANKTKGRGSLLQISGDENVAQGAFTLVILHCQQNRCQTESRTRRKCRTSDMHGQALPLVYVNGHNASEIAVLMITS